MTGHLHAGLSVLKGILECKRHRRPLNEPLTWEGELPLTLQRFPGALDYSEVPFIIPGVSSQTHGSRCPAISELGALLFGAAGGGEQLTFLLLHLRGGEPEREERPPADLRGGVSHDVCC